jgi:hypothetical protein
VAAFEDQILAYRRQGVAAIRARPEEQLRVPVRSIEDAGTPTLAGRFFPVRVWPLLGVQRYECYWKLPDGSDCLERVASVVSMGVVNVSEPGAAGITD